MDLVGRYSNPTRKLELFLRLAQLEQHGHSVPRLPRQRQRHLTPDEVFNLLVAYEQGGTINELAATFGIHRTTVLEHIRRQGAPRRTGVVLRRIHEAQRLYELGWSLRRVGDHLGVDAETVRQTFKGAGLELRPRNGWPVEHPG